MSDYERDFTDRPPIDDGGFDIGGEWGGDNAHDAVSPDAGADDLADLPDELPNTEHDTAGGTQVAPEIGHTAIAAESRDPRNRPITGRIPKGDSDETEPETPPPLPSGGMTRFNGETWEEVDPTTDPVHSSTIVREADTTLMSPHPESIYVESGTVVVGKAAEEGEGVVSPVLNAEIEGTQAITIHHRDSQQGALIHIGGSETTGEAIEKIEAVFQRVPKLAEQDTDVHIMGEPAYGHVDGQPEVVDLDDIENTPEPVSFGQSIASYLSEKGIDNVTIPPELEDVIADIYLDTKTGNILAKDSLSGRTVLVHEGSQPQQEAQEAGEPQGEPREARKPYVHPLKAASEPAAYNETDRPQTLQAVADIAPTSRNRAETELSSRNTEDRYWAAMHRNDAPTTPEGRAELLASLLPDGREGLDQLTLMIQKHRDLLDGIRAGGSEEHVRNLVETKIDGAIDELEARRTTLIEHPFPDVESQITAVERRIATLMDARRRLRGGGRGNS